MARINLYLLTTVILFYITALNGCIGEEEIREEIIESLSNIKSYSYNMETKIVTQPEKHSRTIELKRKADMDIKEKKAIILTERYQTKLYGKKETSTKAHTYIINDMEYNFNKDNGWIKNKISENRWYDEDKIRTQMDLVLKSKIDKLKNEKIGDIDCYLIRITSDAREFWILIMEQEEEHPLIKLLNLDYDNVVKGMDMKIWIDKRTFLPVKCMIAMQAVIQKPIMKEPLNMKIDIHTVYTYYNYNTLMNIELPNEAKKARIYNEFEYE
jgi:outer membrane lipoprotein-sorting protein